MDDDLRQFVWRRAESRCEYCQLPQQWSTVDFEIDHVIARKHGGKTEPGNLALSCFFCNSYKGPNVAGVDPDDGRVVRLFHPRRDRWAEHFYWRGSLLLAQTAVGRTTVVTLAINHSAAIAVRESLMLEGLHPPTQLAD
jgi:hypothetical protein